MVDHLLESSRDDSKKWLNITFGEEITQVVAIEFNFTHLIWSSGGNSTTVAARQVWLTCIFSCRKSALCCPRPLWDLRTLHGLPGSDQTAFFPAISGPSSSSPDLSWPTGWLHWSGHHNTKYSHTHYGQVFKLCPTWDYLGTLVVRCHLKISAMHMWPCLRKPALWRNNKNRLWSDAAHSARCLIRAWTFCHSLKYLQRTFLSLPVKF